jgi:hypothetical protein
MEGQAQGHDIGVVLGEVQRRSVLGKAGQIHSEEVEIELTVDVVELVSILLKGILLIDLPQILLIVGTLVIDALMDTETGTILDWDESVTAVRALVLHGFGMDIAADKSSAADLALVLAMTAIVVIKVVVRRPADRTNLVFGDGTTIAPFNRFKLFAILVFVVGDEKLPVLFLERDDGWKLIDLELLVLG